MDLEIAEIVDTAALKEPVLVFELAESTMCLVQKIEFDLHAVVPGKKAGDRQGRWKDRRRRVYRRAGDRL